MVKSNSIQDIVKKSDTGLENWDKSHASFRDVVLYNFLREVEEKYINTVRFSGDKDLSLAKQKALLRMHFRYGNSCIFDMASRTTNPMALETIKAMKMDKMVLYVSGMLYDTNERIMKAEGHTAPLSAIMNGSYSVDITNSAFIQTHMGWSPLLQWLPYAYLYATAQTISKKKLQLLDGKLVENTANNSVSGDKVNEIYDISKVKVDLTPNQNDPAMKINLQNVITSKLHKIDFSNGESLNDLLEAIQTMKNQWLKDLGVRTNTNIKEERNISNEFLADEVHYGLSEQTFKDEVEMFIEQYQEIFGTKLTASFLCDEVIQEQQEQAVEMARGSQDTENNKGDKDGTKE